jgi:hypothetical protein
MPKSRVLAEPQGCNDLLKKPEPTELCDRVHCRDAEPTREIPLFFGLLRQTASFSRFRTSKQYSLFDIVI